MPIAGVSNIYSKYPSILHQSSFQSSYLSAAEVTEQQILQSFKRLNATPTPFIYLSSSPLDPLLHLRFQPPPPQIPFCPFSLFINSIVINLEPHIQVRISRHPTLDCRDGVRPQLPRQALQLIWIAYKSGHSRTSNRQIIIRITFFWRHIQNSANPLPLILMVPLHKGGGMEPVTVVCGGLKDEEGIYLRDIGAVPVAEFEI